MSSNLKKLWGGRFSETTDPLMEAFNESLSFDKAFYKADIIGSKAYVKGIEKVGILTSDEAKVLSDGLDKVLEEWETGKFEIKMGDEDIHTANERRLGELVGKVAGKLHTGRSRNDQTVTDFRIWMREKLKELSTILKELIEVILVRAETEIDVLLPGYTHLQRAQPIRFSHLLLSYGFLFQADYDRLQELYKRVNLCPLGSGALAGNPFKVDREYLASLLEFDGVVQNSITGVSDRDFVAEFLFWCSLVMTHISRLSEDFIIYSSAEFGFVTLSDAYSTGSSIMPQKKNPDSLELLRGKAGRVFGNMSGFMMTYKGTPSSYNKDLQEDKEPVFDSHTTIYSSLKIVAAVIATMKINSKNTHAALTDDLLATDLADYLVRKGLPFRDAHHVSGSAVNLCEAKNVQLSQLSLSDLQSLHPLFTDDVSNIWNFTQCVENRSSTGGTSKSSVLAQIDTLRAWLKK
ncbi:putative argininosuccinate lyase [Zancudomyces culisetae]|uniref:Argininosuccinate lyase n=1 Tax=Zancudomyces culisetae TaxID=1213189 RepID=A0A1R1PYU7_ZANCU|nr:putative argininosuccinate lyase [Zancudomyces culisetae]|eukprot:OMH86101.1 putative argininosuccinate lyase [Zancudomyces culisetae]